MLLKTVVVVTEPHLENEHPNIVYRTTQSYLSIYNSDDGILIINDVKEGKSKNEITTVAVFNKNIWRYYIAGQEDRVGFSKAPLNTPEDIAKIMTNQFKLNSEGVTP